MHAILRPAAIVFTLVAVTGVARADWGYGYVPNPYATQNYYAAFGYGRRAASDDASATTAQTSRRLEATDFKRAGGRPLLEDFLDSSGTEGEARDQLRTVVEAQVAELESEVRKNNVAAAMGVLYVAAYHAVNDIQIGDSERDEVIAKINDALAVDPRFKKSKAKPRQELADNMLIHAALITMIMSQHEDTAARAIGVKVARKALLSLTGSETAGYEPIIEIPR